VRLLFDLRRQFSVKLLDAVQNVVIAVFLLRLNAFSEKFLPVRVQNDAFKSSAMAVDFSRCNDGQTRLTP
jgi:hypothetical protein